MTERDDEQQNRIDCKDGNDENNNNKERYEKRIGG